MNNFIIMDISSKIIEKFIGSEVTVSITDDGGFYITVTSNDFIGLDDNSRLKLVKNCLKNVVSNEMLTKLKIVCYTEGGR